MTQDKLNTQRLLLAALRGGDFTHAGEKEAIDLVSQSIKKLRQEKNPSAMTTLDVGCGLGGTADEMRKKAFGQIYGIDIDKQAIAYASAHYPNLHFSECDVMQVARQFGSQRFDLIYLFNVFYAFLHQQESLHCLASIAKPHAMLVIFDYTHLDLQTPHELNDLAGKPMHPIVTEELYAWLTSAGWELVQADDLSQQYKQWYGKLLTRLHDKREALIHEFSQDSFDKVHATFSRLLALLDKNVIGGIVIYATLRSTASTQTIPSTILV